MKLGLKKIQANRLGLKREAHNIVRMGLKASDVISAAAPFVALAGPEAVPIASALEAGGMAGKAIFNLASKIV